MIESLEGRKLFSTTLNWQTVAPMPVPRSEGASFVADGKFFAFGGFADVNTLAISNEMDAYDPTTNVWTRVADCPVKVNDNPVTVDPVTDTAWCGGFFLNDGFHASGLMYAYHVQTNTWTQEPSLPKNVGAGQMGVVGRELHYFGGRDANNVGQTAHWKLNLDDPAAGWVADTPMLYTANHDGAVVLNGKIYAVGGIVDKQETSSNEKTVQVFDPATDQWTLAASMPIGLGHIASAVTAADGDILVTGGQVDGNGQVMSKSVLQYDPTYNQWTTLTNLPDYRVSSFTGFLDGKLIVTGGNMYAKPYIDTITWAADYGGSVVSTPTVSVANASATAGSDVGFTVTLSSPTTVAVTAGYTLTPGTATADDFDATAGTLTIPAGASSATVDVPTTANSTGGQFSLTLTGLSTGATFAGGGTAATATGTIIAATVNPAPSTTMLAASATSVAVGQSVTFTATVAGGTTTPAGTVVFSDNGNVIGTVNLDVNGTAVLTTTDLPAGSNAVTARYAGDDLTAASSSAAVDVVVAAQSTGLQATTTTLAASARTIAVGQSDTFVATVVTPGTTATGTITIEQDGAVVGTYPLTADGTATITLPALAPSPSTTYTAIYGGDAQFAGSTSDGVAQVYLAASPATPSLGKVVLPSSAVAGQPFAARLPITLENLGTTLKGTFVVTLYADTTDTGLTSNAIGLATVHKNLTLKAGRTLSFSTALKSLPASVPAGTYFVVARVTDPAGATNFVTTTQTVTVAAPLVSLTATTGTVVPETIKPGKSGTLVLSLTNTGNVPARARLSIQLASNQAVYATLVRPISMKAGTTTQYRLRIKVPAGTAPGVVTLNPLIALSGVTMGQTSTTSFVVG